MNKIKWTELTKEEEWAKIEIYSNLLRYGKYFIDTDGLNEEDLTCLVSLIYRGSSANYTSNYKQLIEHLMTDKNLFGTSVPINSSAESENITVYKKIEFEFKNSEYIKPLLDKCIKRQYNIGTLKFMEIGDLETFNGFNSFCVQRIPGGYFYSVDDSDPQQSFFVSKQDFDLDKNNIFYLDK